MHSFGNKNYIIDSSKNLVTRNSLFSSLVIIFPLSNVASIQHVSSVVEAAASCYVCDQIAGKIIVDAGGNQDE
jgi:hypothetical protein